MSALQHALPTLELRSAASGEIEGYASTFNGRDSYGDSVVPGAFAKSIQGDVPLMLWQHRRDQPVGRWLALKEDGRGLLVRGQLNLQTTAGREAHAHLQAGDINGLSIGYRVDEGGAEQRGDTRLLKSVSLAEISIVSMPADPHARVLQVKRELVRPATLREFEKALSELGFTRREAAAVAAKGFQAAEDESTEMRDALGRIRAINF